MFEKLKEMNAELEALKKTHLEKSKAMFTDVAKELFEKHSVLESFEWTQYTPYFNDGSECTFSAYVDDPRINGLGYYSGNCQETFWKQVDGKYQNVPNPNYDPKMSVARKDVTEFLQNIDEAVLRDMFGDHVQVTVTRNGVEVNEYDHG
jgi:hypothetical protein